MRRLSCALLCVLLLSAGTAQAEETPASLLEVGVSLRREGRDQEALEKFQRANALGSSPRILAQIALAEQALGRWTDAEHHLQDALAAHEDPWIHEHGDQLEQALATIAGHLGSLSVETNVPNAELWIDGARRGVLPLGPLRVESGTIDLEVRNEGEPTIVRSVQVAAGANVTERVEFVEPPPPSLFPPSPSPVTRSTPPAPAPGVDAPHGTERLLAWSTLGAAGALLAGAVVAHVIRETAVARYNDDTKCLRPGLSRDQVCGGDRGRAQTSQTLAAIGYVGAGLLAGASVVLLVTLPESKPPPRSVARTASAGSLGVALEGAW